MKRISIFMISLALVLAAEAQVQGTTPRTTAEQSSAISNITGFAQYRLSPTNVSALAVAVLQQIAGTSLVVTVSGLPPLSRAARPERECEMIQILPPMSMCDGFSHTIFIDHRTKEFWVLRRGGFANVHELFGPGIIQANK